MLKKFIFSIFLMAILSLGNPLRAMEDPSRDKNSAENIQEQNSKEAEILKSNVYSLKYISALKLIPKLWEQESVDSETISRLPSELQEYLKDLFKFIKELNNHCADLEKLAQNENVYGNLKVTEEVLRDFKSLIYCIYDNQIEDTKLILTGFSTCWLAVVCHCMSLEDVCNFLRTIIRCKNLIDINLSDEERLCRDKVLRLSIVNTGMTKLFQILVNCRLLPELNYLIDYGEMEFSFLEYLHFHLKKAVSNDFSYNYNYELVIALLNTGLINFEYIKEEGVLAAMERRLDIINNIFILCKDLTESMREIYENEKCLVSKCIALLEQAKAEQGASTLTVSDLVPDN